MSHSKCNICLEPFNNDDKAPRVLGCGHTFCTMCLAALLNCGEENHCPKCRSDINFELVDDIPINFSLINMIQSMGESAGGNKCDTGDGRYSAGPCLNHGGAPKSSWCRTCKAWICDNCKTSTHGSDSNDSNCIVLEEDAAMECLKELSFEENQSFRHRLRILQTDIIENKAKIENTKLEIDIRKEETIADILRLEQKQKYLDETKTKLIDWRSKMAEKIKILEESSTTADVVGAFQTHQIKLSEANKWLEGTKNMSRLCMQTSLLQLLPSFTKLYAIKNDNNNSKWAKLTIENDYVYIHSVEDQEPPFSAQFVHYDDACKLSNQNKVNIALDIGWDDSFKGRMIIKLDKSNDFAKNMISAVTREKGMGLKGSKIVRCNDSTFTGGEYEKNGELTTNAIIDHIDSRTVRPVASVRGSIFADSGDAGNESNDNSGDIDYIQGGSEFGICTTGDNNERLCFGQVTSGLNIIETLPFDKNAVVLDCSVLVPISAYLAPL